MTHGGVRYSEIFINEYIRIDITTKTVYYCHVGFSNYEICHETYALTRLCYYILTGRTNLEKQREGAIKSFWIKGTSTDRAARFQSVDTLLTAVRAITDNNM